MKLFAYTVPAVVVVLIGVVEVDTFGVDAVELYRK